jgi:hypothetical protein
MFGVVTGRCTLCWPAGNSALPLLANTRVGLLEPLTL